MCVPAPRLAEPHPSLSTNVQGCVAGLGIWSVYGIGQTVGMGEKDTGKAADGKKSTGTTDRSGVKRGRWWLWILLVTAAALGVGVVVWCLVWPSNLPAPPDPAPGTPPDPGGVAPQDPAMLRIQAVRTIMTAVGGVGALAGLIVVMRRQWRQEFDADRRHELDLRSAADARKDANRRHKLDLRSAADARKDANRRHELDLENAKRAEEDATERRITELYMSAAEKLGHEKASVRLAALYALDRLGRKHVEHRREVVEIWCAYLRQPFSPPDRFTTAGNAASGSDTSPVVDSEVYADLYLRPPEPETDSAAEQEAREQEYEVRATAQRLLVRHLKDPRPKNKRDAQAPEATPDGYWRLDRIDLTGATLIGIDLYDCYLPEAIFNQAHFHGHTSFGARFAGAAWFHSAWFGGRATFNSARFDMDVWFGLAQFREGAEFDGARFSGYAWFMLTQFDRDTRFNSTWFGPTHFGRAAVFDDIRLGDGVNLEMDGVSAPLEPAGEHMWPPGYRLVPCLEGEGEPGMGRLERLATRDTEEPDEESPDNTRE